MFETTYLKMNIFIRSMTRGVVAFKYEAEKKWGLKVRESGVSRQESYKKGWPPGFRGD